MKPSEGRGIPTSSAARADVGTSLCPAFPSLKYYIRACRERREPRSRGRGTLSAAVIPCECPKPLDYRIAAVIVTTTYFRHPLVKDHRTLVRWGAVLRADVVVEAGGAISVSKRHLDLKSSSDSCGRSVIFFFSFVLLWLKELKKPVNIVKKGGKSIKKNKGIQEIIRMQIAIERKKMEKFHDSHTKNII